jgi:hypothetical protein
MYPSAVHNTADHAAPSRNMQFCADNLAFRQLISDANSAEESAAQGDP